MRILVLQSEKRANDPAPKDAYTQEFGSSYAARVVGNLVGQEGFCTSCGPDCNACRKPYGRRFGRSIAGVIALPAVLPYLLENPAEHVPRDIPPHDILLAVNVHEQILIEVLKQCSRHGTRGVVAPMEAGDWISGSGRAEAEAICRDMGIEVSFPKPFCAFDPPAGSTLAEFRERFHVGKPEVELTVREGRIEAADVKVSAACGATYYVARWLVGRRVDDDLKYEVISKRLHAYPCTASMEWDEEIGETIMHLAGQAHFEILSPLRSEARREGEMVMSPLGRMVLKPVSARENVKKIETAREAILADLAGGEPVSLESIVRKRKITPAAAYTALLILKQEGKIRMEGGKIVRV